MVDPQTVRLTILWFVVLTFVQTGSGGGGPLIRVIGFVALLLVYALPVAIVGSLVTGASAD